MNWLQFSIAYWLLGKLVQQGPHRDRLVELFMLARIRAGHEFTEDSDSSLIAFLRECFDEAMSAQMPEVATQGAHPNGN